MKLALVLVLAACGRAEPVATCGDDLSGVWQVPDSPTTWFVIDHGVTLEGYPMQPDAQGPREIVTAPRVLDLTRDDAGNVAGVTRRRFMRRADVCEARVKTRVTKCHAGTLEVVTSQLSPPLGFAPCTWPAPEPATVERWQRK